MRRASSRSTATRQDVGDLPQRDRARPDVPEALIHGQLVFDAGCAGLRRARPLREARMSATCPWVTAFDRTSPSRSYTGSSSSTPDAQGFVEVDPGPPRMSAILPCVTAFAPGRPPGARRPAAGLRRRMRRASSRSTAGPRGCRRSAPASPLSRPGRRRGRSKTGSSSSTPDAQGLRRARPRAARMSAILPRVTAFAPGRPRGAHRRAVLPLAGCAGASSSSPREARMSAILPQRDRFRSRTSPSRS
jgi:hypothetical protein